MKRRLRLSTLFPTAVAGSLLLVIAQRGIAGTYKLVDLGVPYGEAADINDAGQIVGWAYNTYEEASYAVFWTNSSSAAVTLSADPPYNSDAYSINNSGQIVGTEQLGQNQGFEYTGAFWNNSGSTVVELNGDIAEGINSSGQIVGYGYNDHAAFWYSGGAFITPVDLGTLGGEYSFAYGINNAGQIVGYADITSGYQHAAIWTNSSTAAIDLGTLGGENGLAYGINNSGEIAGYADTTNGYQHAAVWTNGSRVAIDLGTLGGTTSQANGINNYGQIVGYAYTTGGVQHAAIWTNSNTAAIDLNGLIPTNSGWVLEAATAVNDSGEIVGYGINSQNPSNHYQDAFALLPPAPSILSITLSGNNVTVVWNGTAGSNVVQVSTGTSTGGYSNNFVNVATTILPIFGVASYTDYGGATNGPSRFYRIQATGQ